MADPRTRGGVGMISLEFRVHGIPGAQGSKIRTQYGMRESSKKVKPWRQDVVAAALDAVRNSPEFEQIIGPARVRVTFYFPRPKGHFGTGRNIGVLKDWAPVYVTSHSHGDGDKLLRSTFDALTTAGVWRDDSLAVKGIFEKVYAELPGAQISVSELAVTQ